MAVALGMTARCLMMAGWKGREMAMKNKNNKAMPVAVIATLILNEIFSKILSLNLDRYERCCFYMLLFLCVTEMIKGS